MAEWNVEPHTHSASQTGWPDRLHAVLKRHAIKQVGYVADNGIARLIDLCERDNDVTEVASILKNCAIPCVLVVSMRGEFADFNPWQVPMGSITEPVLKLCGFQCHRIDNEADVESVTDAACRMAFGGGDMQVAILLSQRMVDRTKPKGH